jgi:hypothetical protein
MLISSLVIAETPAPKGEKKHTTELLAKLLTNLEEEPYAAFFQDNFDSQFRNLFAQSKY